MKRLFIGIDISANARQAAAIYIDHLRSEAENLRVGWERPEKLHITLKFLGGIDERELPPLEAALERAASLHDHYTASLVGTGCFPPKGQARILWLGVRDDGETVQIASSVEDEFSKLGYEREKRKFSPHLTIARLREPDRSSELSSLHLSRKFEPIAFEVDEIVLYESRLQPSGSEYSRLKRFSLK